MTAKEIERLNNDIYSLDEEEVEKPTSQHIEQRAQIQAQLFAAEERRIKIQALQAKRGYSNLNLREPGEGNRFQRRFKYIMI